MSCGAASERAGLECGKRGGHLFLVLWTQHWTQHSSKDQARTHKTSVASVPGWPENIIKICKVQRHAKQCNYVVKRICSRRKRKNKTSKFYKTYMELLALSFTANSVVVATEWYNFLMLQHVLKIALSTNQAHPLNGSSCLSRVLQLLKIRTSS